ncbi:hypothetical protein INT47_007979 [Mucor saturninus]|uniref:Sepiapterin reductase n=1 Tax=Mucor saturninus TaxID=64648 RepID=A0A8H7QN82_9FUNG|nr:hypothetical protein INT47_007979 [Mucor saturninus]
MLLPHNLYVITGANRGFGKVIAQTLAKQSKVKTSFVLVGRSTSSLDFQSDHVSCYSIDNACLSSAVEAQKTVIDQLNDLIQDWEKKEMAPIARAILINNAGSTGDLSKKVGEYTATEIGDYVNLNITSYISIVTGFIRLFSKSVVDMTIVNISSLLAVQAFPNWALYATGKSARDMLLKVVALEEPSIRTLSYAPGPLDNEMQQHVRETLADPEQNKLYTKMANEGNLVKMEDSATKLAQLIEKNEFESGSHIDFYDV